MWKINEPIYETKTMMATFLIVSIRTYISCLKSFKRDIKENKLAKYYVAVEEMKSFEVDLEHEEHSYTAGSHSSDAFAPLTNNSARVEDDHVRLKVMSL